MKIVVMSDSHGFVEGLEKIYLANSDADMFIHLGDGVSDVVELKRRHPDARVEFVRGNCDYAEAPRELVFRLDGVTLFAVHGNEYNVKYGVDELVRAARERGAQVALFGHTHRQLCELNNGLWLVNPGSVAFGSRERLLFSIVEIGKEGTVYCANCAILR